MWGDIEKAAEGWGKPSGVVFPSLVVDGAQEWLCSWQSQLGCICGDLSKLGRKARTEGAPHTKKLGSASSFCVPFYSTLQGPLQMKGRAVRKKRAQSPVRGHDLGLSAWTLPLRLPLSQTSLPRTSGLLGLHREKKIPNLRFMMSWEAASPPTGCRPRLPVEESWALTDRCAASSGEANMLGSLGLDPWEVWQSREYCFLFRDPLIVQEGRRERRMISWCESSRSRLEAPVCLPPPFQKTARPQCSRQQLCVRLEGAVARHPEDSPPPGFCVAWAWADPGNCAAWAPEPVERVLGVGKTQGAEGTRSPQSWGVQGALVVPGPEKQHSSPWRIHSLEHWGAGSERDWS